MVVLVVTAAACAMPLAALADSSPASATNASQMCKQLKTSMDAAAAGSFAAKYGTNASKSNAFGKCVSQNAKTAGKDESNAAQSCKTERAADPAAFATKYGTNGKAGSKGAGKNAFGKCVSSSVKHAVDAQVATLTAAAASCKAAMKSDPATFAKNYGSKRNAFGKCVSAQAKAKPKK
ncbi:MAG: hypothetical protein ACRDM1_06160 [Gaiellaceae bacterium]